MRRTLIIGALAATLLTGSAVGAVSARVFLLNPGDTAVTGDTQCRAVRLADGAPGFRCFVGGDYRAKYGVIIGSHQAAITQYSSFNRYRIIVQRRQSPVAP